MTPKELTDLLLTKVDDAGWNGAAIRRWLASGPAYADPASLRRHRDYPGGLAHHWIGVTRWAFRLRPVMAPDVTDAEITVASVLHDASKIGTYEYKKRWRKDEATGRWEPYDSWEHKDRDLLFGHGDASAVIAMRLEPRLPDRVLYAIRWHMGAWDRPTDKDSDGAMHAASMHTPLVLLIQTADTMDTHHGDKDPVEAFLNDPACPSLPLVVPQG